MEIEERLEGKKYFRDVQDIGKANQIIIHSEQEVSRGIDYENGIILMGK
jgi:hypothetical protein